MILTVDRFEGSYAILELPDKTTIQIPKEFIKEAKEGDVLRVVIDKEETNKRKKKGFQDSEDMWID